MLLLLQMLCCQGWAKHCAVQATMCSSFATLSSMGCSGQQSQCTKVVRRVQKHGPVFMSNLYGTKTVVVADFAGWEKVRRCGAMRFRIRHH